MSGAGKRRPRPEEDAGGAGMMDVESTPQSGKRLRDPHRRSPGDGKLPPESADNLYFQDPFGDDFEEADGDAAAAGELDEKMMEAGDDEDDDEEEDEVMNLEDDEEEAENAAAGRQKSRPKVWRPGVDEMRPDEELIFDNSVYTTFHRFELPWPCLSLDIITDSLGQFRKKFPQTMFLATGTQAMGETDFIYLLKITDIHRTIHDDDSDPEDDLDDLDDDPELLHRTIQHPGAVNRIRSLRADSKYLATMAGEGGMHIWNAGEQLLSLDDPLREIPNVRQRPIFSSPPGTHRTEGWALDWSPTVKGGLLSGDMDGRIFHWIPRESGWTAAGQMGVVGTSHTESIEDLQWSPVQATVFASGGCDRGLRLWDTRAKNKAQRCISNAHDSDINVISWNRLNTFLMASGGDDGILKIWDLRKVQHSEYDKACVGMFKWHQNKPITSLQWHPTDDSIIACSSEDNTISFWDLALEADEEEGPDGLDIDIPPQLLFHHQGQQEIKELVFHPQIPSMVISSANSGFHLFKPSNMN